MKTATETHELLAVVNGNESMSYMCFFKLFRRLSGKWEPWIKVWGAVNCLRSGNSLEYLWAGCRRPLNDPKLDG